MMVVARFTMFLVQLSLKYNYELLGPSGDLVSVGLRLEIGIGIRPSTVLTCLVSIAPEKNEFFIATHKA